MGGPLHRFLLIRGFTPFRSAKQSKKPLAVRQEAAGFAKQTETLSVTQRQ